MGVPAAGRSINVIDEAYSKASAKTVPSTGTDEVKFARPTRSRRLLPNAQAARNTANDVTFESNFVGQGRAPSGMTLTFACSRTNLLTAKNGPGTTVRSLQSGRLSGK